MPLILACLYILILLFSQRFVTQQFSRLIHKFGGGQNTVVWLYSLIFLPGTLIHEVSHLLMAAATGARTGQVTIFPEFIEDIMEEKHDKHVRLGSVQVQRMNPVQGFLVGFAPFIIGLALMVWLAALIQSNFNTTNYLAIVIETFLFVNISNSLFPSWEDIKQTLPLIVILAIAVVVTWLLGLHLMISPDSRLWLVVTALNQALIVSLIINLLISSALFLVNRLNR